MKRVLVMGFCSKTVAIYIFIFIFVSSLAQRSSEGEACVSLVNSPFEICMNAGYDATLPFPEYITEARKREIAREVIAAIKSTQKCAAKGLAEAIECSFVAPKCGLLGDPIYPCRQVCAEFLKQCEFELDVLSLDYLISSCLVLSNGSSNCARCFMPPNFTTDESVPGPLDRGCQELIIPACKNLGLYNYTLSSVPVQKETYNWMYQKNYTDQNPETEFPDFMQKIFEKHPKCQENIKKLFCGEHLPPCFPAEGLRPYTLCQPLCDQIAIACPEFFSHDLSGAEYCGTMASGKSMHGFCQSSEWPETFSWAHYAESTKATTKATVPTVSASSESKGVKLWAIIATVLLSVLVVGLLLWAVLFWRVRLVPAALHSERYIRQPLDADPMETDT